MKVTYDCHTELYFSDKIEYDPIGDYTNGLIHICMLAQKAKLLEWGTEEQIEAENALFDFMDINEEEFPNLFEFCLKATTHEQINYILGNVMNGLDQTALYAHHPMLHNLVMDTMRLQVEG